MQSALVPICNFTRPHKGEFWSQSQLAEAAGKSLPTIKRLEREDGEGPTVSDDVRGAVQAALEKAGCKFIPENGGGAGVRLARRGRRK